MLRNYFKIALRNLWKHRLFSAINLFGLASALTICLLAIAHSKGTLDYDSFHPKKDRLYRVLTDAVQPDNGTMPCATAPMPLATVLKQEYAFVEEAARVVRLQAEFTVGQRRLPMVSLAVDPAFFRMFGYALEKGRPALEPNTVVLTRRAAERYFGHANPIGKVLHQKELGMFTVTGVLADHAVRSHLEFDQLLSLRTPVASVHRAAFEDWRNYHNGYVYVLLKAGTDEQTFRDALSTVQNRHVKGLRFADGKGYSLRPQPLTAISPSREQLAYSTDEPQIGGLLVEMGVGLVTLLLAAFNYVNLTLARSMSRAREVGIRKVAGALRRQVIAQFMAESVVLSLLALGLACVLLEVVKPMAFVQQWLIGGVEWDFRLWSAFIVFSILTGLLAGFVPARILSRFQPAQVLRSQTGLKVIRSISLRKSLIVIQFVISLVAMIGLLTMTRQFRFMATADYGFRREGIFSLPLGNLSYERMANAVDGLAGVERVAATSELMGMNSGSYLVARRQQRGPDSSMAYSFAVNADFVPAMNLKLLAGENLRPSPASVGRSVLLNEEAVRAFKLGDPREAVGQSLWLNDSTEVQIAGVLKDFRFMTLANPVRPLILRYEPDQFRYLAIRVVEGAETRVLAEVRQLWKRLNPYEAFEGQWYDEILYQRHNPTGDIQFMSLLLGLAFSIACLGLLGMVTYHTQTRTREVGIRKVMGAEVGQLVWLLSREFVRLLLLAGLLAIPLGYAAGTAFLFNFAYHVSIGWETFALCLGVLLLLGSLTIGLRTYRAASVNPVDSLRSE